MQFGQIANRPDNEIPAPVRSCYRCGFHGVSAELKCPRCSSPRFLTERSIRIRGIVGIAAGLVLVGMMVTIGVGVGLLILGASSDPHSAPEVRAATTGIFAMYLIFGAVTLFGLHSIVIGTWHLIAGRPNKFLVNVMWLFFALIFVAVGVFHLVAD